MVLSNIEETDEPMEIQRTASGQVIHQMVERVSLGTGNYDNHLMVSQYTQEKNTFKISLT